MSISIKWSETENKNPMLDKKENIHISIKHYVTAVICASDCILELCWSGTQVLRLKRYFQLKKKKKQLLF